MNRKMFGVLLIATSLLALANPVRAETPEEWVKLGARVHGGYGAFIPLGVRIGLDAMARLKAAPRSLLITYHDNPKAPCACFADGVALAATSSFGQRSVVMSAEQAPPDMAAVIEIRPRAGGAGLKYFIPMASLPRLAEMNKSLQPLQRHEAVMKAEGLFRSEPAN